MSTEHKHKIKTNANSIGSIPKIECNLKHRVKMEKIIMNRKASVEALSIYG